MLGNEFDKENITHFVMFARCCFQLSDTRVVVKFGFCFKIVLTAMLYFS